MASRLHDDIRIADRTEVSIPSFPFVGRLLVSGSIPHLSATAFGVGAGRVRFDSITARLHDVRVDRGILVRERRVALRSVGAGEVEGELSEKTVSDALGAPVSLRPGVGNIRVVSGTLVVSGAGVPTLRLPVPKVPLLPCAATARVVTGKVIVSCTVSRVPPELVDRALRAG